MTPWPSAYSGPPPPFLTPGLSLWTRKTRPCALVLITIASFISLSTLLIPPLSLFVMTLSSLTVSAEMPTIFFDKGGWVENSFQHPLRPLWVPCHAFQPLRNYINVPTLLAASRQWRQNYNVGIWEFLALTLPVQEWRYWLAGTKQPFIIRTDY